VSADILQLLRQNHAFDHHPPFDELARLHIAFENLVPGSHVEARVIESAKASERVALIGPSGAGKSSVVAHCVGRLVGEITFLHVPISDLPPLELTEPGHVAAHILRGLVRQTHEMGLLDDEEKKSREITASQRQTTDSVISSGGGGVSLIGLSAQLGRTSVTK